MIKVFMIAYGGRTKEEMFALLKSNGVRTVVDVRSRLGRVSMGILGKAKTAA